MSLLAPLISVGAAIASIAFTVLAALWNALVGVATWTYIYAVATANVFITIAQNKKLAAGLTIGLVASIIVGAPLVSDPNLVLSVVDFGAEGPLRIGFEVFSKIGMINIQGGFNWFAPKYNQVVGYVFVRLNVWFIDVTDAYNIMMAVGDYFQSLEIVKITWDLFKSLGYFPITKSAGGKTEIFPLINPLAQFYPFATPASGTNRYETDPDFGAFPQVDVDGPLYYLRNFFLDGWEIIRGAGDIIFTKIAEFAFPGQKFFPSFYLSIDEEASFWRQLADWITRVISFVTGESFYPKEFTVAQVEMQANPQSVQPKRFNKQKYVARVLRILAQLFRTLSLIVIHSTTIRFPPPLGAVAGTALELIKIKLIGVPGVDLFLDPAITAVTSPVILAKHLYPCRVLNDIFFSLSPEAAIACSVDGGIFRGTLPLIDDDIPASAYNCIQWNSIHVPLENNRVDYVYEAYQIIPPIAQLIEDPNGLLTTAADEALRFYKSVIASLLNLLYAYIHFIGSVFYPACNRTASIIILASYAKTMPIRIIEYFYTPLKCVDGVVTAPVDPLTCFITINSRTVADTGFWGFLCDSLEQASQLFWRFSQPPINFFDPAPQQYQCLFRKRNVASQKFTKKNAPEVPMSVKLKLTAMLWASESRKALDAVKECVFNPNTTAAQMCATDGCSISPCFDTTLDCVVSQLPKENQWRNMLDTRNNTNVLFRNSLTLAFNLYDMLSGCGDSIAMRLYKTVKQHTDATRSFFARWTMLVFDYVPAYFACMEKLRSSRSSSSDDDNMQFAYCIGLISKPPEPVRRRTYSERTNNTEQAESVSVENSDWQTILNQHGVVANSSWCANRLHTVGIDIDDAEVTSSLSLDHLASRFCAFQLAFGMRAILAETSPHTLTDYLGGWTATNALLGSMDSFGEKHLKKLEGSIPEELPKLEFREYNATADDNAQQKNATEKIEYFVEALQTLMPSMELAGAMFNYYADLHDHVATSLTTPEEKHEMDQRLLFHHLGMRDKSTQKRSAFRPGGAAQQPISTDEAQESSEMFKEQEERKRNFANTALKMDTRISVVQEFGRRLYWAGTYPMATAMDEQEETHFEFDIDQKYERLHAQPTLSIRVKHTNTETGLVLNDPASQTLWHTLPISDIGELLNSLNNDLDASPQQKQLIMSALSAYEGAKASLVQRDQYVKGAMSTRSASATIKFLSTVIYSLARIFNRRARLEALPAFQSASMFLAILSGRQQQIQHLPAWMNGQMSYIHEIGFVDNDVYELYMKNVDAERKLALSSYSTSQYGESVDISLFSVKRARMLRAEAQLRMRQKLEMLAMEGFDPRLGVERQRRTATSMVLKRHLNFAKRSSFLVKHSLHAEDTSLHLIAPDWWASQFDLSSAMNSTQARARFSISASLASGDFLAAIDQFLEFFGAPPNTLENALMQLETSVVSFFTATFDPAFFTNFWVTITNYLTSVACDVPQDVRLAGTGFYKFFCIPYLDEKAFTWYQFFPKTRNYGILGYFLDAGFIRWPVAMVLADCPAQRDPLVQCPADPPPPIFLQDVTNVPLDQFETPNGQNVDTFPIDTTSWLGNICLTDWCKIDATNRPYCPTFDYCTRTYFPSSTFGFVTGTENLVVWSNDIRVVYSNVVALDSYTDVRFWSLLLLFLLLAFSDFIYYPLLIVTIPAPAAAYLTVAVFIIIEIFILLRIQVYILVLIYFWILLETLPLLAWVQWTPLIVHIGLLHYNGTSFLTPFFNFVPNLFPDTLIVTILNWFSTFTFLNFLFDVSVFSNLATSITTAQATFVADELNNVQAVLSFWNTELLILEIAAIAYLSVYLIGVLLYALNGIFPLFAILAVIGNSIASFFTALTAIGAVEAVEDLEEESVVEQRRIIKEMRTRDELRGKENERLSEKITLLERKTTASVMMK